MQKLSWVVLNYREKPWEKVSSNYFLAIEEHLYGKKIALFGSHQWGCPRWMSDWENCVKDLGGILFDKGLTVLGEPDREDRRHCVTFGEEFARF